MFTTTHHKGTERWPQAQDMTVTVTNGTERVSLGIGAAGPLGTNEDNVRIPLRSTFATLDPGVARELAADLIARADEIEGRAPATTPDIPIEAVEAAARARYEFLVGGQVPDHVWAAARSGSEVQAMEAALTAALPHLPQHVTPHVEDVARWLYDQRHSAPTWDELTEMGGVGQTAFRDQAHELMALLSSQPTVEDDLSRGLPKGAHHA